MAEAAVELPGNPGSARTARRFVDRTLESWGGQGWTDSALLLVSELVTNVVLHARTAMTLVLREAADVLRIEVHDESPRLPTRKTYGVEAGTGRGLMLVEQLSQSWGAEPNSEGTGKVVWFELERGGGGSGFEDFDIDAIEELG